MQKPKTVLTLDDDNDILIVLERILKNGGFKPILAKCPDEARALMDQYLPHIIITDLNMEPEDGQSFIRSIRQQRKFDDIPIIVLSAVNEFEAVKKVMTLGISDYSIKPIHSQTILRKIKKAILHQDYLKIEKISKEHEEINIELPAEIMAEDENGMELKGSFKLAGHTNVKIESEKINGEYRVSSKLKNYIAAGVFVNEIEKNK